MRTLLAYQRRILQRIYITIPHLGVGLVLEMLSALIPSRYSYPALPVFRQQAHQGSVPPGPLVLGRAPLKNLALALDRDRTVSRITSTITSCMDYIFIRLQLRSCWRSRRVIPIKSGSVPRGTSLYGIKYVLKQKML